MVAKICDQKALSRSILVIAIASAAPWNHAIARAALGEGLSGEYAVIDLDQALRAVGEVIGVVDVEQILDSVFSQFCIGK